MQNFFIGDTVQVRGQMKIGKIIGIHDHKNAFYQTQKDWIIDFGPQGYQTYNECSLELYSRNPQTKYRLESGAGTRIGSISPSSDININQTNNKTMDNTIKNKFTLMFKSEPEKSFRLAGITNGDDFLTSEGQNIFLSWLLKRYGNDFKKEVVDKLLKDLKKD